jgi:hypothetical protein
VTDNHQRSVSDLRRVAVMHWPQEILDYAAEESILPLLLKTQDAFISILKVSNRRPDSWKVSLAESTELGGGIFVKHLMVIADLGGEALNKLRPIGKYFPGETMTLEWRGASYSLPLNHIASMKSLNNASLRLESASLRKDSALTPAMEQIATLILFGGLSSNGDLPEDYREKCSIGAFLGNPKEIEQFVKQRYLFVSRIVGGGSANSMGHAVQKWVVATLKKQLPVDWKIQPNATISGVKQTERSKDATFDIVVTAPRGRQFGIEVSFQVTTNSTIERKARESQSLYRAVHKSGNRLCYVIDGAGNIEVRQSAVARICDNSDCTVAMSVREMDILAQYMRREA